jgi:predicted membrane protein
MIVLLSMCGLVFAQRREDSRREAGRLEELSNSFKVRSGTPFQLRVEVDAAELRVAKGKSRDEILVNLAYTQHQFSHSFRFNETRNALEVQFDKEGWFKHERERTHAEIDIELPPEGELQLDFKIKAGEINMELGGLRIIDFALETLAGEVNVDFAEPNLTEMASLTLNTKIGESKFRRMGNARFRDADINGGIGELTIDFTGEMAKDAVARVDLDIGETVIVLPRESGTRLSISKFLFLSNVELPFELHKDGRYYYSENYERADRTLQLRLSSGVGECRIEVE